MNVLSVTEMLGKPLMMLKVISRIFFAVMLLIAFALIIPAIEAVLYSAKLASMAKPDSLNVPVYNVKKSALRDTWHVSRDGGKRRHEGIDIFAPKGTPVISNTEGVVARIGSSKLGGKVIWIWGPGRQGHYYAHLDGYTDIQIGKRIHLGTVLGYVGNTGNARATPPHLHYGIYEVGRAINPYPLLKKNSASP
jgi:murein DD-endopeptidase MepM/ murein hydrolase activator NlpD